jgi:hypothetical protein
MDKEVASPVLRFSKKQVSRVAQLAGIGLAGTVGARVGCVVVVGETVGLTVGETVGLTVGIIDSGRKDNELIIVGLGVDAGSVVA